MTAPLKILLLEDSATDVELIERLLQKHLNCTFNVVDNKIEYLKALNDFYPGVILSDHSLPDFNSAEALKITRRQFPNVPFILVTGTASEEFAANIIKLGADDYILKDRMARLPLAITSALKKRKMEEESHKTRELARQKIELAEERERVAIEAACIGIYDLDIITGNVITSQRYNQIFGYDESRPLNDYLGVIHPEDVLIRYEAFETSKFTGRLKYEIRLLQKDSAVTWIRADGIVHKNEQGVPVRVIGSVMDITEFKYLLKQKDNFIGVASHELKTPITTVKAYTHILEKMLKERGDIPEVPLLNNINKQVDRLCGLINNLLDSTKMISGQLELNRSDFKIDALVTEVITALQVTTNKKIVFKLSAGSCRVRAGEEKVEQIIINLITNALKFSSKSDKIIVKTIMKKNAVKLEVQDFGIGIKKENIAKIFEQFYREDNGLGYTFPGLGLGLFISGEIIKKEGGKIEVKSTEGKGSTFSFSLPCSEVEAKKTQLNFTY